MAEGRRMSLNDKFHDFTHDQISFGDEIMQAVLCEACRRSGKEKCKSFDGSA